MLDVPVQNIYPFHQCSVLAHLPEGPFEISEGMGAGAVIDFVGEGNSIAEGLAKMRNNGAYYIVGYGGEMWISALDMIGTERHIIGNYAELVELMELDERGI